MARIRIRRDPRGTGVVDAMAPKFARFSLVGQRMFGDAAQWPDVYTVLDVLADPIPFERSEEERQTGRYHSYSVKSIVTGQIGNVSQGDLMAVEGEYLEYVLDYYRNALKKLQTAKRKVAPRMTVGESYIETAVRIAARAVAEDIDEAVEAEEGDQAWDEAVPAPEVADEDHDDMDERPAPRRRVVPDEDEYDEEEDRPYVPRSWSG